MQQGTEVDYDDALCILAFRHPVATLTPIKGKDGKYIEVLTDEDKKKIQKYKDNPLSANNPSTDGNLQSLIEAQGMLLKSQQELMAQMRAEIDVLKKGKSKK